MKLFIVAFGLLSVRLLSAAEAPDYSAVEALLTRHCLDCHATHEPEGGLVLESFDTLMKGGESGLVVKPGHVAASPLVQAVETGLERDGKKKLMPPGKRAKLKPEEITLLKSWIKAGALPPQQKTRPSPRDLVTPSIKPRVPPRRAIHAAAHAESPGLIALARYGEVESISAGTRAVVRRLQGHLGHVNAVAFTPDGKTLAAAGGLAGVAGEVRLWRVDDGHLLRTLEAHTDAIYAVAISPDGATLATGSYDHKIKLWNLRTGEELRTLSAHNGAIYDLAFRPDGKILASASGDRTVKLWDVKTGRRMDTLSQPLKELYAVAFAPDGRRLAAGGVDNRIRLWEISDSAAETTNPLLLSRFAHEGAILNLVYSTDGRTLLSSADDRTVKLFDAASVTEKRQLPLQPDVPPALAFVHRDKTILVGRLDGSTEFYDADSGQAQPPPKPNLLAAEPRGFQRGLATKVKLTGSNLVALTQLNLHHEKLTGRLLTNEPAGANHAWISVTAASELPRGSYEISVTGPGGESGRIKLHLDDLPHVYEIRSNATTSLPALPADFWGTLETAGDSDTVAFEAQAGQTLVCDLAAKSLGSKLAHASLTLLDAAGAVLESNAGFDGGDPFLTWRVPADGRYRVRVADRLLGASQDHFYRLTVGELPYAVGIFPTTAPTNSTVSVNLIGFNLGADLARVSLPSRNGGDLDVPLDPEKVRARRAFKLLVTELTESMEHEPNDRPETANALPVPGAVNGRILGVSTDLDLFRFEARSNQTLIVETLAAQRGSPLDTRIEILHPDGQAVARVLLQATRDSAVTFRGIDSVTTDCRVENWEEMELNEWLYLPGEVVKLFRAPQGPDSGFLFYAAAGKRRCYFDTSATAHALGEPCYIVQPHAVGTRPPPNGLPVFTLPFANDDDGERRLGLDSRLSFAAPTNGAYLVRVTDTRGLQGERFTYRLLVRAAQPDFRVSLGGTNPTIGPGSSQAFTVTAERLDGFEDEIRIDIAGLPPGFTVSSPLVIQAGHTEAKGTLHAAFDATKADATNGAASKIIAHAKLHGKAVTREVNNFGRITLGDPPKLWVSLEPYAATATNHFEPSAAASSDPLELTIAPGQTIPAWLKIKRNGHNDLVTFFVENLPHGVIVADIGLSGVLIPKGESERRIFLSAAAWVPETERPCYAIEQQAGRQTSRPVLLKVRRPARPLAGAK